MFPYLISQRSPWRLRNTFQSICYGTDSRSTAMGAIRLLHTMAVSSLFLAFVFTEHSLENLFFKFLDSF